MFCFGGFSYFSLLFKIIPVAKLSPASEHRVESEEKIEKENKSRQRMAPALQETKKEDEVQR